MEDLAVSNPFRAGGEALMSQRQLSNDQREVSNPFRAGGEALCWLCTPFQSWSVGVSNPFRAGGEALPRTR